MKDIRNNEKRIRTDTARYPEIGEMRPKGKSENDKLPAEVYFYYIDLGDICPIYSYLRGDLRKEVLRYGYTRKHYGKETTKQYDTWLEATRNLRNFCAHHLMLSGKTSCVILPEFGEDYLLSSKTDLFSRLYALKKILPKHFSDALKKDLQRLVKNSQVDVYGIGILPRDWEERFEKDIYYINHISLWMDIKIIFKTVSVVLHREGISSETSVTMEEFMGTEMETADHE